MCRRNCGKFSYFQCNFPYFNIFHTLYFSFSYCQKVPTWREANIRYATLIGKMLRASSTPGHASYLKSFYLECSFKVEFISFEFIDPLPELCDCFLALICRRTPRIDWRKREKADGNEARGFKNKIKKMDSDKKITKITAITTTVGANMISVYAIFWREKTILFTRQSPRILCITTNEIRTLLFRGHRYLTSILDLKMTSNTTNQWHQL